MSNNFKNSTDFSLEDIEKDLQLRESTETMNDFYAEKVTESNKMKNPPKKMNHCLNSNLLHALAASGIDLVETDEDGNSPLIVAIANGEIDTIKELLDSGVDIEATNEYGETALTVAANAIFDTPSIIQILINAGAKIKPEYSLIIATELDNIKAVNILIKKGVDIEFSGRCNKTPLYRAAQLLYPQIIQCLINAGANLEAKTDLGETPLIAAINSFQFYKITSAEYHQLNDNEQEYYLNKQGHAKEEVVRLLIEAGSDVNTWDHTKKTPLMYACSAYNWQIVVELINAGADVNARDEDGKTPLMYALDLEGDTLTTVIHSLIEAGANINATTNDGKTALIYACAGINENPEYIHILIAAGADTNAIDSDGKNALQYAIDNHHQYIIAILSKYIGILPSIHNQIEPGRRKLLFPTSAPNAVYSTTRMDSLNPNPIPIPTPSLTIPIEKECLPEQQVHQQSVPDSTTRMDSLNPNPTPIPTPSLTIPIEKECLPEQPVHQQSVHLSNNDIRDKVENSSESKHSHSFNIPTKSIVKVILYLLFGWLVKIGAAWTIFSWLGSSGNIFDKHVKYKFERDGSISEDRTNIEVRESNTWKNFGIWLMSVLFWVFCLTAYYCPDVIADIWDRMTSDGKSVAAQHEPQLKKASVSEDSNEIVTAGEASSSNSFERHMRESDTLREQERIEEERQKDRNRLQQNEQEQNNARPSLIESWERSVGLNESSEQERIEEERQKDRHRLQQNEQEQNNARPSLIESWERSVGLNESSGEVKKPETDNEPQHKHTEEDEYIPYAEPIEDTDLSANNTSIDVTKTANTEEKITRLINNYLNALGSYENNGAGNLENLLDCFSAYVNYFDEGLFDPDKIESDNKAYFNTYPKRYFGAERIVITESATDTFNVTIDAHCALTNRNGKRINRKMTYSIVIMFFHGEPKITSINSRKRN